MTQKERQERSREEIYRAALEEFGTCGYDRVNMERICGNHGISKGMMYHYYSGKDELFLLCVEKTFSDLHAYVEEHMSTLEKQAAPDAVKHYFMLRESYFQDHPRQKVIFESAMLRPHRHLIQQIQELRAPIRRLNQEFLEKLVSRMPLRTELNPKAATRYLESVESCFPSILSSYQDEPAEDFHSMLEATGEILNMILFGILQQPKPDASIT